MTPTTIAEFLNWLRPAGSVAITSIVPDGKTTTATFTDYAAAERWALEQNAAGRNVYFTPQPTRGPVNKKPTKADIARVEFLFCDLDPFSGEDLDTERARIRKLLNGKLHEKGYPATSITVDSGNGYNALWRLAEPINVDGDAEKIADAERYTREIVNRLGGDKGTHNIDRLLRLPFTRNLPNRTKRERGRTPTDAKVYDCPADAPYPLSTFPAAAATEAAKAGSRKPHAHGTMDAGTGLGSEWLSGRVAPFGTDELRAWCRAQGKWHEGEDKPPPGRAGERLLAVIAQGKDPIEPTRYQSRSEAQFYVSCELVRLGVPDDIHYRILTTRGSGVADSVLDKPDWHNYALRQIGSAREEADKEWWRSPESTLAYLNSKHAVISDIGGKCRIISETVDEEREDRRVIISLQSFEDFRNRYRHIRVVVGFTEENKPVVKPVGAWWLDHHQRQQFEGMVFAPGRITHASYNLWRGFSVEARPGNKHQSFLSHIRENLCSGNEEHFSYLIGWMARAVQQPGRQGEVAVVMRGGRGTGKSFFGQAFGALFGRHFLEVSNPKHLVGNFNAHLRDTVLLFGDEAFFAGDKQHESVLKTLVTSQNLVIEGKHVDAKLGRNYTHLILASNDSWVVPAGEDERRYFVLDVADNRKQDHAYFSAIQQDLDSGGLESLLDYLLSYDLSAFEVRKVPATDALKDQKAESLRGFEAYLLDLLLSGQEPVGTVEHIHGGRFVPSRELLQDASEWLRGKPGNQHVSYNKIQVLLEGKLCIAKERNGRNGLNGYVWSLDDLRAAWEKAMFPVKWTSVAPAEKMPF